jgi:predicted  nucleic acid-binding Zn-ribbon protein
MEFNSNMFSGAVGIMSLLFGLVGWMLRRVIAKIDGLSTNTESIKTSIAVSQNQVETIIGAIGLLRKQYDKIQADVQSALIAAASIADMKKEIAILERNQSTVFKKLDLLSDSISKYGNVVSILRSQLISKEGK